MYGLAAHEEQDEKSSRWMEVAKVSRRLIPHTIPALCVKLNFFMFKSVLKLLPQGITNTCHESYDRTDTKLGPEAFR